MSDFGFVRGAQALGSLLARQTVALRAGVFGGEVAVVSAVAAIAVERLARWAGADAGCGIEREVLRTVALRRFLRVGLVIKRVGFGFVFSLILEAFVALAHAVVGD